MSFILINLKVFILIYDYTNYYIQVFYNKIWSLRAKLFIFIEVFYFLFFLLSNILIYSIYLILILVYGFFLLIRFIYIFIDFIIL